MSLQREKSTSTSMLCSVNGLMIRTRAMVKLGSVGRKRPEEAGWNIIVNNVQCFPLEHINCKTKVTRKKSEANQDDFGSPEEGSVLQESTHVTNHSNL